jgi:CIC family chloride channel protein
VPLCLGGLLFGLVTAYIGRRRGTEVDPIEANALHGGRMSMRGSLIVAAQTVWSSGIGASVGLEAGLHATRQWHRIGNRALISPAAHRHAHAGRLRAAAAIAAAFGARWVAPSTASN